MGIRSALVVVSIFATAWAWAALQAAGSPPMLVLVPVAISLALLAWGWRDAGAVPSRGRHVGRVVGIWSGAEVVALAAAMAILQRLHRPDLAYPVAVIIVGLHFYPLARGIPVRLYNATASALVGIGLVALLLPAAERPVMVGIGAALTLWATAFVAVLRARQNVAIPAAG